MDVYYSTTDVSNDNTDDSGETQHVVNKEELEKKSIFVKVPLTGEASKNFKQVKTKCHSSHCTSLNLEFIQQMLLFPFDL